MSTTECSCRLWPSPGMYVVTSIPVVSRTRATLRSAEFGFFGVVVYTRVQTPRRWGEPFSAGVFVLDGFESRPLRTSWAIVGTRVLYFRNFERVRITPGQAGRLWGANSAPHRRLGHCYSPAANSPGVSPGSSLT